jgi:hypothetical protein
MKNISLLLIPHTQYAYLGQLFRFRELFVDIFGKVFVRLEDLAV